MPVRRPWFVMLSAFLLLLACEDAAGGLPDGGRRDAAVRVTDDGGGAADASGPADAGLGDPAHPEVALVPPPPAYWYVDALPLSLAVGGASVTHYRYRLDTDADLGPERAVTEPLVLDAVPPGLRTLSLVGCNASSGACQETPMTVRFHMATTAHAPIACDDGPGGPCDWIITGSGDLTNDGEPSWAREDVTPAPGDVICLANGPSGTFDNLRVHAFSGSAEAPLTFINCGGPLHVLHAGHGAPAIHFERSRYFRLVGVGSTEEHGIQVEVTGRAKAINVDGGSSDFEIAYVEVTDSGQEGIAARTDASCTHHRDSFAQENTFLHHNVIRGVGSEGFYVGGSHWGSKVAFEEGTLTLASCGAFGNGTARCGDECVFEPELRGVRIYANVIQDTESDCLQLSSAPEDPEHGGTPAARWDAHVYDNVADGCVDPLSTFAAQGFSIQSGTNAFVYRNVITNVRDRADAALLVGGRGSMVFNNIVVADRNRAIAITLGDPGHNRPFLILNNTVVNTRGDGRGIALYGNIDPVAGNLVANNLVLSGGTPIAVDTWDVEHNLTGAPDEAATHFMDPASGDYCLRDGSGAIGYGRDLSSYGVVDDFLRRPRAPGAYDVGACQR